MKFFINLFLVFFLTAGSISAGGLDYEPTQLLPEEPERVETPVVIQVIVQQRCRGSVVYYNTPGVTSGGVAMGASTANIGVLATFALSAAVASSSVGIGGVSGTTGQSFPVVTSCYVQGEENEK